MMVPDFPGSHHFELIPFRTFHSLEIHHPIHHISTSARSVQRTAYISPCVVAKQKTKAIFLLPPLSDTLAVPGCDDQYRSKHDCEWHNRHRSS